MSVVDRSDLKDVHDIIANCLVGRILATKNAKCEALKIVMMKVWKLSSGLQITVIGDNLFFLFF